MIRKNLKLVLLFVLGVICAVGITFAYIVSSKNIVFKSTNWNVKNVEEAIDYLKNKDTCPGFAPPVARVISGDINTVGSVVKIGDEEFYVVGQGTGTEEGKTKLLTKYELNNNNQVETNGQVLPFASSSYWNEKAGEGLQYPGNYEQDPRPYVYDSNCNVYSIVEAYVEKIANLGLVNITGRIMSKEEAGSTPSNIRKAVATEYYWLGSARSGSLIYRVQNNGVVENYWFDGRFGSEYGVRPLLLVPTNQIG